jgi:CRISPR-associated protein Csm4
VTTYRLQLRPHAPWATPLRADSLFGAICWRWLELFPESFDTMLNGFAPGGEPPFILSDAFPGELLPLPLHRTHPRSEDQNKKKLKPPLYIRQDSFRELAAGAAASGEVFDKPSISGSQMRTAIDRELGNAAKEQLFEIATEHLTEGFDRVSVYIRTERFLDELLACFRALAMTGFGKKSSSGLGAFELIGAPQGCDWLDQVADANGFVSLSHFVPAAKDPADGCWRLHVTYPKFHANSVENVFKGSILMLTPGSVFRTGNGKLRPWYGSMLPMARREMPKAIHYGLAFAAPMRWPEEAS